MNKATLLYNLEIIKMLAPWKKSCDKPRQHIKCQHHFANKGPYSQSYGFSSSHVWIWELDHKERSAPKNWCFWTVVLEKTLESLSLQGDPPDHPKGNQSWIPLGRTDAEAPILWPPDAKNWLMWKDHDAGKDWRRKKGTTEDEVVGWNHNRHEFEQAPGVGDGQGGLVCYSSRRPKSQATKLNFVILSSWGISPFSCPRSFLRPIFQTLVCLLLLPA